MKFRPFSNYQFSGVKWCPEVPSSWKVSTVKRVAEFTTGWTPSSGNAEFYGEDYLWANISDIGPKVLYETSKGVSQLAVNEFNIESSKPGDLLFSFKLSIGQVSFVGREMFTNEAIATFKKNHNYDIGWAYYAFPKFIPENAEENIYSAPLLNQERIKNAKLFIPPKHEQLEICKFLDRETAKIDELIQKQEKLIELLSEARQALINNALTKGISKNVKLKRTDVQWFMEIPAHWGYSKLGLYSTRVVVGIAEAATHAYQDIGTPILRATNIRPMKIVGDLLYLNDEFADERGSKALKAGDLVTVRTGNAGVTALVPKELDGCQCFTMLITTVSDKLNPIFMNYWMNSSPAQSYFSIEGWGTAQVNISVPILKQLPIPIPPLEEQNQIVEYLQSKTIGIDALISKTNESLNLLMEHRVSLISAAVTGKIDVRELA